MSDWKSFVCASVRVLRLFPRMSRSVVNNRSYISLSGDIFARSLSLSHSFDLSLWKMLVVYVWLCFLFFLSFLEVHCPPIVTLKHISLSPPACGENEVRTGASCQLTCPRGYSLIGNSEVRCLPSGNWSGNLHKATCTGDLFSVCVYNDKQYYVLHETSLFVLL